ncbi:hypothetical protein Nepgr_011759 [Nepenthes gracilis]|uniref:Uncharacterized protein n=1 Tax=Nepenthes gracilis TaxID=150966 RepID=A0AAD3SEN6_NEPGR|nr:hypothetical protein Nepgr_011759 [Nepenthes gracilis]
MNQRIEEASNILTIGGSSRSPIFKIGLKESLPLMMFPPRMSLIPPAKLRTKSELNCQPTPSRKGDLLSRGAVSNPIEFKTEFIQSG